MRYVVPLAILVAIIAGLGITKSKQISILMKAGEAMKKGGPPPESVATQAAKEDTWEGTIAAVGSVAAVRGVAVSSEVPGVVTAIKFESGNVVHAGQILVELDTSVERAQLASLDARRELAQVGAERSRRLAQGEFVAKAQLDTDDATLKGAQADASALKAQIERKTLRAPFAGRLGLRTVNLGQYLNPGTPVTVLESLGSVYVDFSLPQEDLSLVKVGTAVRATMGNGAELDGAIGAIDPTVDAVSRTIKLRASVPNKKESLRPGMFVRVTVVRDQKSTVVTAPLTAVVHASYGDSVFVVEDKTDESGATGKIARQQFVRLGPSRGDFVAILDGVKTGQELVTAGAFKLRNGSPVVINNEIKPTPSLTPKVENQ
jgi:membrane fusion protein (multidrug efflux system)